MITKNSYPDTYIISNNVCSYQYAYTLNQVSQNMNESRSDVDVARLLFVSLGSAGSAAMTVTMATKTSVTMAMSPLPHVEDHTEAERKRR